MRKPLGVLAGLLGVAASFLSPIGANATPIGLGDFGSDAVIESFEGYKVNPAIHYSPSLLPGTRFASGIEYVGNANNAGVSDLTVLSNGGCFGSFISQTQVPDGGAYICGATRINSQYSIARKYAFALPTGTIRFGGLSAVTTAGVSSTVYLDAYDVAGSLLETVSYVDNPGISNWGSNFLGIEQLGGIAWVELYATDSSGDQRGLVIDALQFETVAEVPEPAPLALLLLGALGLIINSRLSTQLT